MFACSTASAQLASPISEPPGGTINPGAVVWADLVTSDVETAVDFYSGVFGWDIRRSADPNYVEMMHNGKVICAVARFDDEDVAPGNARWLVSISVTDVDETAGKVEQHGGGVLEAPEDFPDRGRFAVISDSQGALLMLLRASGGDPGSGEAVVGAWGWAELWTRDVADAARFYEAVFGYRAISARGDDARRPVVLTSQGRPRATIIAIPWDDVEPNWLPYAPVADARQTLQQAIEAGGTVLLTSDDVEDDDGTFAAIVADPTGGVFAIQQTGAGQ
jgi:predicted enzyme related to lactoylglutathione lyase